MRKRISLIFLAFFSALLVISCSGNHSGTNVAGSDPGQVITRRGSVSIGVTSENHALIAPLKKGMNAAGFNDVSIQESGSVVVARALCTENGKSEVDVALMADSNVAQAMCPDQNFLSKTMYSATIEVAMHRDVAKRLGWDQREVSLKEFRDALTKDLKLVATVPGYSWSSTTLLARLAAVDGDANFQNPETQKILRTIFNERRILSSEGTGWLLAEAFRKGSVWAKDNAVAIVGYNTLFHTPYENKGTRVDFDSRPEMMIIKFKTPIQVLVTAYVNQDSPKAKELFEVVTRLKDSQEAQKLNGVAKAKNTQVLPPLDGNTMAAAINAFGAFRENHHFVFVLDTSGSMQGSGIDGLHKGAFSVIDPDRSKAYNLFNAKDEFAAFAFNSGAEQLSGSRKQIADTIATLEPDGGTQLFDAATKAIDYAEAKGADRVVFFTDGAPDDAPTDELIRRYAKFVADGKRVIFVAVGDFDEAQVNGIASQLSARVIFSSDPDQTATKIVAGFADLL